jgi:transposase-like protein
MNSDNFPRTLQEAVLHFADKDVSVRFMAQIRWPEGVRCPHCDSDKASFVKTRRIWNCLACKKQFSVKVGSLMEDSPLGLDKWLMGIWLITGAKNGISSCEVARALGITQKSAWFLMHRIRFAMQKGSFEKLSGHVEADETFIGGKARNMHLGKRAVRILGRGPTGKAIVLGLLERSHAKKGSRVHAKLVEGRRKAQVHTEVRAHVEEGSTLYTDALRSYEGLEDYTHKVIDHAEAYAEGVVHTNGMENFWSLLKRSIKGTYVSVEPYHLFRYLDEQSFRFNERQDNDKGRFLKAAAGIAGKRLTYSELTGKDQPEAA